MSRKKFFTFLAIALVSVLFAGVSILSATYSWFILSANHTPDWKSSSQGAYFAYGTGTKDDPYGITRPIHMYNLAWLQYFGHFETNLVDDTYNLDNIYFELAQDVDMAGWTLPPIGTRAHPFVGNFDGQGYKITNLTVSNTIGKNNITKTPFGYNPNDFPNNINVLGLFGVVGKYESNAIASYDTSANEIINTGISGLTVKTSSTTSLVGLAAGYLNGKLEGVAVNNSNIDLSNSGGQPIAGFNGNISDYSLVGYAKVTQDNNPLGNFQHSTTTHYAPTLNNPFSKQGGTDWGGSIDMRDLFTRLTDMKNATHINALANNDPLRKLNDYTVTYQTTDGVRADDYTTNSTADLHGMKNAYYDNTAYYGNAVFAQYSSATSGNTEKHYLVGGQFVREDKYTTYDNTSGYYITNGSSFLNRNGTTGVQGNATASTIWEFETTSGTGYIRTVNERNYYYLRNNNGNLSLTTDTNANTLSWTVTQIDSNNLRITSVSGNTTYILLYQNGNWGLYDYNQHVVANEHYVIYGTYNNTNYYIPTTVTTTNQNADLAGVTTDQLEFNQFIDNQPVSFKIAGSNTTYYLCYYVDAATRNGNWYLMARNTSTDDATHYTLYYYNGGYIGTPNVVHTRIGRNSYTDYYYVLRFNNGRWVKTRVERNRNQYVINTSHTEAVDEYPYHSMYITNTLDETPMTDHKTQHNTSTTANPNPTAYDIEFTAENTTYLPISVNEADIEEGNEVVAKKYEASDKNTGYYVAGATTSTWSLNESNSPRSVVVADYAINKINKSYDTGSNDFLKILTIDGNQGNYQIKEIRDTTNIQNPSQYKNEADFVKYKRTKSTLKKNLKNKTTVDGFHFVTQNNTFGYISQDRLVNAKNVSVLGDKFSTYQLPAYSIDFKLKEQGYINFFAGSYTGSYSGTQTTTGANCFFSLHKVTRYETSPYDIKNIKEIKGIYKKEGQSEYVYSYKNGSSVVDENGNAFSATGLTLIFNTDWIGYNSNISNNPGCLWYFEIPVDQGEFCLGNVTRPAANTKTEGCYLIYLDIGASMKNQNGITIADSSTTVTNFYNYPLGIDFGILNATDTPTTNGYTTFVGGQTSAIIIPNGSQDIINYEYSEKTVAESITNALLSVGPPGTSTSTYLMTYKATAVDVENKAGDSLGIVSSSSSTTYLMEREIIYDLGEDYDEEDDSVLSITVEPTIFVNHKIDDEDWVEEDEVTAAQIVLQKSFIDSAVSLEQATPVVLYEVEYSRTTVANNVTAFYATTSDRTILESSFDLLNKAYEIEFDSTDTTVYGQIKFTTLTFSQTYDEVDNAVAYVISVTNTDTFDNETVGQLVATDVNNGYIIILIAPASQTAQNG